MKKLKVLLVTGLMSVFALGTLFAATPESEFKYDLLSDGIIVLGYKGKSTVVDIPETIEGEKVVAVDFSQPSGSPESKIKELTIPKYVRTCSIQYAGNNKGAYNVEKLIIKSTVLKRHGTKDHTTNSTNLIKLIYGTDDSISFFGFEGCLKLKEVQLPEGMEFPPAFGYSPSLEKINFPSSLKILPHFFLMGTKLKTVDLSNTKVSIIGKSAFAHNFDLEKVIFPKTLIEKMDMDGKSDLLHKVYGDDVDGVISYGSYGDAKNFGNYNYRECLMILDKAFANDLEEYEGLLYKNLTGKKELPTKRVMLIKVPDWSVIGPVVDKYFSEHPREYVFSSAYSYTFGSEVFKYQKIAETTDFSKIKGCAWGITYESDEPKAEKQFKSTGTFNMPTKQKKQIRDIGYNGDF